MDSPDEREDAMLLGVARDIVLTDTTDYGGERVETAEHRAQAVVAAYKVLAGRRVTVTINPPEAPPAK